MKHTHAVPGTDVIIDLVFIVNARMSEIKGIVSAIKFVIKSARYLTCKV